jgi:hypothetical protein
VLRPHFDNGACSLVRLIFWASRQTAFVAARIIVPHTIDDKLDTGLFRCGCPVTTFAALAKLSGIEGASAGRLFQAFRGEKELQSHTSILLWQLFREIDSLVKTAAPLRLDLSNPELVHQWLTERRNGTLQVTVEHGEVETDLEMKVQVEE